MIINITVEPILLFMILLLLIGFIWMMSIIYKVKKWSKFLSLYNEFLEKKYGEEFIQFLIDKNEYE